jgi:hypothetical protein
VQDLRLTDPRYDKKRIEDTKGGLLEDSYRWILENSDFQRWHETRRAVYYGLRVTPVRARQCCSAALLMSWKSQRLDKHTVLFLLSGYGPANQPCYNCTARAAIPTSQPTAVARFTCTEKAQPRRKSSL